MSEFEAFYRANVRLLYALAFSRTADPSQAEDLTQETFLRAWQHFDGLSGGAPRAQRAWLIRTLRNLAADAWRRESLLPTESLATANTATQPAEQLDLRLDLARALGELDDTGRDLVTMRYLQGMNSREIGEVLGMPQGTVRRRLAECRRSLAQRLSHWRGEDRQE